MATVQTQDALAAADKLAAEGRALDAIDLLIEANRRKRDDNRGSRFLGALIGTLSDETLKNIAIELVTAIQSSASIDWNLKESVRAAMRARIRRLLAKYDYPPDREERAVELVLEQAELFAASVNC